MKKRIVSLLLALVMVLSLVPATVWAAENHDVYPADGHLRQLL